MMITLLKELVLQFREVAPQSYHHQNTASETSYPYLTFDLSGENLEQNVEGFYVDVDIFDNGSSYMTIFELENRIREHFKGNRKLTDDMFIRFKYLRSNTVSTESKTLKRRNLQFYCKVDWRN